MRGAPGADAKRARCPLCFVMSASDRPDVAQLPRRLWPSAKRDPVGIGMLLGSQSVDLNQKTEPTSQRQQLIQYATVGPQRGGGACKTHGALLQHIDAVGKCEREFDALLR